MHITYYAHNTVREIEEHELHTLLESEEGALWIDILVDGQSELDFLRDTFQFHPLALEDVQNQKQRPKAEEFVDHLFIILNTIEADDNCTATFHELDIFVGNRYMVTAHQDKNPVIERVHRRIDPRRVHFPISATYLLYMLIDTVIDEYMPVLENIENTIDELGTTMVTDPKPDMVNHLFQLKLTLNEIWRVVWPKRDIINVLVNHELVFIDPKSQYYLRDIADHLTRITDMTQTARDTIPSLISLYMSAVSNQLNVAVNRLTIFTIVLGIMAGIGGFYGMNFEQNWPPFDADWGVLFVLVLMIVMMTGLLYLWRRFWLR